MSEDGLESFGPERLCWGGTAQKYLLPAQGMAPSCKRARGCGRAYSRDARIPAIMNSHTNTHISSDDIYMTHKQQYYVARPSTPEHAGFSHYFPNPLSTK